MNGRERREGKGREVKRNISEERGKYKQRDNERQGQEKRR